jgi:hypothetical protein
VANNKFKTLNPMVVIFVDDFSELVTKASYIQTLNPSQYGVCSAAPPCAST